MPGITRKLHVEGTVVKTGRALYRYHEACDACGCLVHPEMRNGKKTGRKKCSGRCGIVSDAIPASELGITEDKS